MEEKIHTLSQDNGGCNDIPFTKLAVKISDSELPYHLRKFFRWRKDVTAKRLYSQGSRKYDLFIKYLYEKGYGV